MHRGIIDRVLDSLAPAAAEARLLDLRVGAFWTVAHTSLGCGMASSMVRDSDPHDGPPIRWAGELDRRTPLELAQLLRSESAPEAAIGLAVCNGLIGVPAGLIEDQNAETILRERGRGRRVAMIGRFPFAERLRPHCRELWVFERRDHGFEGDLGEKDVERMLPSAEVVAVTATTLLNGTLGELLEHVDAAAFRVLLGPTTPLHPVLLDVGFDVLCGSLVVSPGAVLRAASEGAVTRQIPAVRRVSLWRLSTQSSEESTG